MNDIDKLFESIDNEILTESVKLEMSVLFENAINEAIKTKEAELEAKNTAELTTYKESIVNQLDAYLTLFVEEFTAKNEAMIVESVKVKTAEKVLKTFSQIVTDFNLQLSEKVETDETALNEAKEQLNKVTHDLVKTKKQLQLSEKAAIVTEAISNMSTEMQKAKVIEYAKTLPYDELFEKKVNAFSKTITEEVSRPFSKEEKVVIQEEVTPEVIPPIKETPKSTDIKSYIW